MADCIRFDSLFFSISVSRISIFFFFGFLKKAKNRSTAASTLATETKSENLRITDYPICPTFISFYEGFRILALYCILFVHKYDGKSSW